MDGYLFLILQILLLIVLIAGSAFFSSCEMALFSLGRAKVAAYKDDPSPAKRRSYFLLDNYTRTLVSIILSNMFVNSCISMLNDTVIHGTGLTGVAATAASAVVGILILLLFGEITPMTLAYVYCDPWSKIVAAPVCFMRTILFPVVWCAEKICNRILDILGRRKSVPLTHEEFDSYIDTCTRNGAFTGAEKELLKDVSLHVKEQGTDAVNVAGRGEMHLSILMETMRREGFEFSVSTPRVLTKVIDGTVCEPIERMVADVPEDCMGAVIEKMGRRKGDLLGMTPMGSRYRLEFLVPSRGLFGYRSEFLTDTRGEGIMSSVLDSYAPMKGEIERRQVGSLVAFETGEAVAYGLAAAQERGALFIGPGTSVYAGMVVGVCSRNEDMTVNVCKKKQLTNMRAAGSDAALRLTPARILSLEQCLEFLADDELLECTPKSLRIRKRELDHAARMRNLMKKRAQDNT